MQRLTLALHLTCMNLRQRFIGACYAGPKEASRRGTKRKDCMTLWRSKVLAFLLALVAISAVAGPASATPAYHHRHHRHHHHHHRAA